MSFKLVQTRDVRQWLVERGDLAARRQTIGARRTSTAFLEDSLNLPYHLTYLIEKLGTEGTVPTDALDSISFYSLCRGFFLPLSYLDPDRAGQFFGLKIPPQPDAAEREALLESFLEKEVGLTLTEKFACILGDPFMGHSSKFRRESILRLLLSLQMTPRSEMLDRLTQVGDVAVLAAESRAELKTDNPLTAAEVLRTLCLIPTAKRTAQFDLLRSLLTRCGKVEAFFLARLLLRRAGFGFDYQGPMLARLLAPRFGADPDAVYHAMTLTDLFRVIEVLEENGADGLREIQLQPLVPVRPALAGGTTDQIENFPVWVERKYDGIRLMVHKATDANGSVLCGAYTRNRRDWLELVPGLDQMLKMLGAHSIILDGELYGTVFDIEGTRPANVYEVYANLQGEGQINVRRRFAAFDIVYLNGQDLTPLPLHQRRQVLQQLLAPILNLPADMLPLPFTLSEGQLAQNKDDVNRLYNHFRSQGYEGVIAKNLNGPYRLATRDAEWMKRKPEITLDLVVTGATFSVTTKQSGQAFGSYVIAARGDDGLIEIGDVAGVDRQRDMQIQQTIAAYGLMTGRRIERPSSSGVRPGIELMPHIVITVKFEGIVRDGPTGRLSLRDPKLAMIRSDKHPTEADTVGAIEELYLKQRVG